MMQHPECQEDELFYANVNLSQNYFKTLPFKTKRLGSMALNDKGDLISFLNPVFIKREEFETLKKLQKLN